MVQFVMSSESMAPSSPKRAPEAPTDISDLMDREDKRLPPNPEITYSIPIFTAHVKPFKGDEFLGFDFPKNVKGFEDSFFLLNYQIRTLAPGERRWKENSSYWPSSERRRHATRRTWKVSILVRPRLSCSWAPRASPVCDERTEKQNPTHVSFPCFREDEQGREDSRLSGWAEQRIDDERLEGEAPEGVLQDAPRSPAFVKGRGGGAVVDVHGVSEGDEIGKDEWWHEPRDPGRLRRSHRGGRLQVVRLLLRSDLHVAGVSPLSHVSEGFRRKWLGNLSRGWARDEGRRTSNFLPSPSSNRGLSFRRSAGVSNSWRACTCFWGLPRSSTC